MQSKMLVSFESYKYIHGSLSKILLTAISFCVIVIIGYFSAPSYDVRMGIIVGITLLLTWKLVFRNIPKLEVMSLAVFSRFLSAMFYIWTITVYYKGRVSGDSLKYYSEGIIVAESFKEFRLPNIDFKWGSNAIYYVTGIVLTIIGPTFYGGFLLFTWLAFVGSYLFYRAFEFSFPESNKKLYSYLIFFCPSIVFWTSQIGKDALMFFFLGLIAYCTAWLRIKFEVKKLLSLVIGLAGVTMIRPHIAVPAAGSAVLAFVPLKGQRKIQGLFLTLIIFAVSYVVISYSISEFKFDSLESILDYASKRVDETYGGGSRFHTKAAISPKQFALSIVNSIVRPFPWEAHNFLAMAASMEAMILSIIILIRLKNIFQAITSLANNSYILFILSYSALLIFVISTMANYGILVRQRVQLLPFLLMLVAYHRQKDITSPMKG